MFHRNEDTCITQAICVVYYWYGNVSVSVGSMHSFCCYACKALCSHTARNAVYNDSSGRFTLEICCYLWNNRSSGKHKLALYFQLTTVSKPQGCSAPPNDDWMKLKVWLTADCQSVNVHVSLMLNSHLFTTSKVCCILHSIFLTVIIVLALFLLY